MLTTSTCSCAVGLWCPVPLHCSRARLAKALTLLLVQVKPACCLLSCVLCCCAVLLVLQGKRYSLPNSRIMIHQPLGGAQGQATDIEIQANEILHHKLTLNGYLVSRTEHDQRVAWHNLVATYFLQLHSGVRSAACELIV